MYIMAFIVDVAVKTFKSKPLCKHLKRMKLFSSVSILCPVYFSTCLLSTVPKSQLQQYTKARSTAATGDKANTDLAKCQATLETVQYTVHSCRQPILQTSKIFTIESVTLQHHYQRQPRNRTGSRIDVSSTKARRKRRQTNSRTTCPNFGNSTVPPPTH